MAKEYINLLDAMVKHMILADPERWPHREAALNYIYCEEDNGLEWAGGDIKPCNNKTFDEAFGTPSHDVPDIEHRMKEFNVRERPELKKLAEFLDVGGVENWYKDFKAASWEMLSMTRPTEKSLFFHVPDRGRHDWFDGAYSVHRLIYDQYQEEGDRFEALLDGARRRTRDIRMAEEVGEYRKSGLLTSWLHMESSLCMCCYEHLEDQGLDKARPSKWDQQVFDEFAASVHDIFGLFLASRKHADPLRPIHESFVGSLYPAVEKFKNDVWLKGLQQYYKDSDRTGHGATINGVAMLMAGSAGRVLVTLRKVGAEGYADTSVTLIGTDGDEEEDSNRQMGLQGIQATKEEALRLLYAVCEVGADVAGHFSVNNEVSFA